MQYSGTCILEIIGVGYLHESRFAQTTDIVTHSIFTLRRFVNMFVETAQQRKKIKATNGRPH